MYIYIYIYIPGENLNTSNSLHVYSKAEARNQTKNKDTGVVTEQNCCDSNGKRDSIHHHLLEVMLETAAIPESRQKPL